MNAAKTVLLCACLALAACTTTASRSETAAASNAAATPPGVTGILRHHDSFPSRHVAPRNVDVWLPPGYDDDPARRYPVVYAQDGQNLFYPKHAYTGDEWGVDEVMTALVERGEIRPAIVVGIWNTPQRIGEYMPEKAVTMDPMPTGVEGFAPVPRGDIVSDDYLAFIVGELKPFIDAHYRTLPGREDTFAMGSSMGGLISAYAVAEYPDVFGGAAALSSHWPACDGCVVDWLAAHLPDPATHRFYFDHGTATLDAAYAPYQQRMDAAMRAHGYVEGRNWLSRTYPGADHSEKSWHARLDVPLRFLLAPPAAAKVSAGR
jgi:enterochelin esterase-like enzyme